MSHPKKSTRVKKDAEVVKPRAKRPSRAKRPVPAPEAEVIVAPPPEPIVKAMPSVIYPPDDLSGFDAGILDSSGGSDRRESNYESGPRLDSDEGMMPNADGGSGVQTFDAPEDTEATSAPREVREINGNIRAEPQWESERQPEDVPHEEPDDNIGNRIDAPPPTTEREESRGRPGRRGRGRRGGRGRGREQEGPRGDREAPPANRGRVPTPQPPTPAQLAQPSRASEVDDEGFIEVLTGPVEDAGQDFQETDEFDDDEEVEIAEPDPADRREMLINVADADECRIALLREGRLDELYMERASSASNVGNIYKGRVTNVEPSIQAAFVDFGLPAHGFLHISDLHPRYFPESKGEPELVGRKTPRRQRPPIQACLRRGQEVMVQIIKEGIGSKGPTLSTYISLPGRFLVMMPGMDQLGVSRKIEDEEQRRKLRDMLGTLSLPKDMGFIVRTAGIDRSKRDLQRDLNYLVRLWKKVAVRIKSEPAPAELYKESDLVIRTIRDVFDANLRLILVDDASVAERVREFLSIASPRALDMVKVYDQTEPMFYRYGVESEIEKLHSKNVPLSCGGSLVIEQTEALVAIDVNSGRFRVPDGAEETAYRVNLDAVDEIARQLRLRDLGGLIICDFIDMMMEKHRRHIENRLSDALSMHKERAKILRISRFGVLEMTRQRQRPSFAKSMFRDCPRCNGSGRVKATETVGLDVMRQVQLASQREGVASIDVKVSTTVANDLLNRKRHALTDLERARGQAIRIHGEGEFGLDQVQISCTDRRGREIPINAGPITPAPRRSSLPPPPIRVAPQAAAPVPVAVAAGARPAEQGEGAPRRGRRSRRGGRGRRGRGKGAPRQD